MPWKSQHVFDLVCDACKLKLSIKRRTSVQCLAFANKTGWQLRAVEDSNEKLTRPAKCPRCVEASRADDQ